MFWNSIFFLAGTFFGALLLLIFALWPILPH